MAEKQALEINETPAGRTLKLHGSRVHRIIYVLIAAVLFFSDQATKALVVKSIPDHAVIPVIPGFFNLIHAENSGIAFSMFASSSGTWKMALLIGVSVALLVTVAVTVWRSHELNWQTGIGLALVLGGALSNLADRIRFGQVVDFLDFYFRSYHWATFNLADSAIVVGAGFLVLEFLFSKSS